MKTTAMCPVCKQDIDVTVLEPSTTIVGRTTYECPNCLFQSDDFDWFPEKSVQHDGKWAKYLESIGADTTGVPQWFMGAPGWVATDSK